MRKQYRVYLFLFCFAAVMLIGLPGTGMVFAKAQTPLAFHHKDATLTRGPWRVVPSPNGNSFDDYLSGVTAVSASDVWAVGSYANSSKGISQTLIEHWNGTSWSVVASPNVGSSNYLEGVAAVSASGVWAVGQNGNGKTLVELYH